MNIEDFVMDVIDHPTDGFLAFFLALGVTMTVYFVLESLWPDPGDE